ncbi:hypothetical protein [Parasitella parasitica]|uniref:ASX DEUBAD domain-containing protein n=1 Tax=Parasitella parasitica TaxID=35722 RepID=A0A0B7NN16_9FUNG|nr:hypothetical protein [Parasitella parasitica]
MYSHPSNQTSVMLSPMMNKRREIAYEGNDNQDNIVALETSQLMIRSPPHHINASSNHGYHHHNHYHSNKRPRYEPSWTLDNLCTHPCSPLAAIDLEVDQNVLLNHSNNYENYPPPQQQQYHRNNENYNPASDFNYNHNHNSPDFFSKSDNPIFWNSLTEWQTMLGHGEFYRPESPLQLSPSPPTTTNNSSSNKSTASCESKPHKQPCKKDRFKDEAFESYWGELIDKERAHNVAGDSKSITLKDMCRKGLIREQDVIVYKRNFSACKVVVSKSMTVIKACGLSGISVKLGDEIFEDFETPTALETKILDHHGKVTKDKRPNGNAFKSIRLIRAGKDMGRLFDIRKDGFGDQSGC